MPPSRSRASAITRRGLARVVELRQAGDRVGHPAVVLEAGELHAVELHAGHLGEHLDEPVLDDLEAGQRLAELRRAAWRRSARCRRRRRRGRARPRRTSSRVATSTRPASLNVCAPGSHLGHADAVERDVGLPDRARRRPCRRSSRALVARACPVSTRKPLTWPSSSSRAHTTTTSAIEPLPIQRLAPSSTQSSPSRRARRLERDGVRAVLGLGQREGADLVEPRHRRQPALLLLLGPEQRRSTSSPARTGRRGTCRGCRRRGGAPCAPARGRAGSCPDSRSPRCPRRAGRARRAGATAARAARPPPSSR